jgi:hypothetical protein
VTFTTSVALPTKAVNVRREPRVSLLFSDPTGSGQSNPPQVLIRGRADCPDVLVTDPEPLARFWARLYDRQPGGTAYSATAVSRRLMDWYYFRLVITVDIESAEVRPPAPRAALGARRHGATTPARTARELRHYRSAVLSWLDPDGAPTSARVLPEVQDDGALLIRTDADVRAGAASLLAHRHDEQLWKLRSFVTVGALTPAPDGALFRPERYLPGASPDPRALLRTVRAARRTTTAYLERHDLERPTVPWDAYRALYHRPDLAR